MQQFQITNPSNEKLMVHVYKPSSPKGNILFVHGWGVGKYEGDNLFKDWMRVLKNDYRCILFDFSGVHESEGKPADICFTKEVVDLNTMIDWVNKQYQSQHLSLIAHSRGCQIVAKASPEEISKIVFSCIPNWNSEYIVDRICKRITSKTGKSVDKNKITAYPRSDGTVSLIGPKFWSDYDDFNLLALTSKLSDKTKLLILHPDKDDVVGHEYIDQYGTIENAEFKVIPGNHSYSSTKDRRNALLMIEDWITNQ